jgi:hypothetical protein
VLGPAVSVAVEDAAGNLVTTDKSTVTLALATGPGTLGGTTTATVSNSLATFGNLLIQKAGTYTLSATDGSLSNATSASFTISPGAASQLVFSQQPTNVTPRTAISPAVTVAIEDAFSNIVTKDTASVSIALSANPGGAILNGTTWSMPATASPLLIAYPSTPQPLVTS